MATATTIGLDIGAVSIRAVETARGKHGTTVTNFGQVALPPGTVEGGVIADDQAVTLALKQLWATAKFRGRQVVLGVTNPQVVVRELTVANLPPQQRRQALPFQVAELLPLPVERSLLDFCPLEEPGRAATVRGLLVAAPKEAVLTAVRAVERAGLTVVRVDLASFALLRAASRLDARVEALVDIGAQATSVVVHVDGQPLIVRTIPRGGADLTSLVASRLNLSDLEAEQLKCQIGLVEARDQAVASVLREGIQPLINEIRSSFAYLVNTERPTQVTRVVLSGGGALLAGLPELLHGQLDLAVTLADPAARLRPGRSGRADARRDSLLRARSSAAVCVGLALRAA